MKKWPLDELQRIAGTDDLHISPLREDDVTTERRRGFGPSLWETGSSCVPITVSHHDGTKPR